MSKIVNTITKMRPHISFWEASRELNILERIESKKKSKKKRKNKMASEEAKNNKRARFDKYKSKRLQSAVDAIRLCENMANKNAYSYEPDEAKTIVRVLQESVSNLKHAFTKGIKKKKNNFFE